MPEPPEFPRRDPQRFIDLVPASSMQDRSGKLVYAELHCCTNYSFLQGASHPDELVTQAAVLGYAALAITDVHSLSGVVQAHAAAKESQLQLLIGAEIRPVNAPRVVLLATDRASYGRLSRLITVGRCRAPKGECQLNVEDIATHQRGLLAAIIPTAGQQLWDGMSIHPYRDIFSDRCYLLAELLYGTDDRQKLVQLKRLSQQTRIPLVAAGDVHYHISTRMALQHVLTAIRHGTTVSELKEHLLPNAERHLRPLPEIHHIFRSTPSVFRRTGEIAGRCTFSLDELRYDYPEELAPSGQTPMQYLHQLAWQGARKRYGGRIPDKVCRQLDHELKLIEELHYEAFFLTVYDLVKFARSKNILCQGRGSAANSTVCYCLEVTAVDPMTSNLLFERFVSRERDEAPDIDVDFEHERREEVLQYIYQKYGRDRAGLTAVVITYRPRSAIRDVGKVLGLSLDRVDVLAKNLDFSSEPAVLSERCRRSGVDPDSQVGKQLLGLTRELLGFPRHLSQHVGGMVITQGPLCELVPIENATMDDRTVIQWDKNDLAELGILKVDCLALGILTAIHKCFDTIETHTGRELTIDNIPQDDAHVYDMITRGDTVGVFQIESRAQMSMLPRLRPREFYDLVIEVAIVRPGPIQGNMVHPYLRRRNGEEKVTYPSEEIKKVLRRTLGVPLFQEQAMQLAVVAAGFTLGEADQLRRAMGAWRRPGVIDKFRNKLIDGMFLRGYTQEYAERVFNQIRGFGEYGFPESHAASFAKLAYVSAWLKYYYPAEFSMSLINSQPMGFYAPAQLVRDVQNTCQGPVEVRPIDVNYSEWYCTLERIEPGLKRSVLALRLGMCLVRGLSQAVATKIMKGRTSPFVSLEDVVARTQLSQVNIERLVDADAFRSITLDRRHGLWQSLDQEARLETLPLFSGLTPCGPVSPKLPTLTEQEEVVADYQAAGLSLRKHPLAFYRKELSQSGVTPARLLRDYSDNRVVKVAGIVLMRQRPSTARGITFVTLEDETGVANLVIHKSVWKRFDALARQAAMLIAQGRLERQNEVIHIVVQRLEELADQVGTLAHHSRDFR